MDTGFCFLDQLIDDSQAQVPELCHIFQRKYDQQNHLYFLFHICIYDTKIRHMNIHNPTTA